MMAPEDVQKMLLDNLPGAEVTVEDLTGTQDHFFVTVMSAEFTGKALIEQHQMVNQALKHALEDGRIHALKIKTHALPA